MLLALLSCLVQPPSQVSDTLAARIYAVVLDSFYVRPGIESYFIYGRTATGVGHVDDLDYRNGVSGLAPLPDGLEADFAARRRAGSLVPPVPSRLPSYLLTDSLAQTLPRPMTREFWSIVSARYPGIMGMFGFSPVGFSTDRKWAMVMVDWPRSTVYFLLELRDGRWVVTRRAEVRTV